MLSVNRWNPFDDMATLHRDFDRAFGRWPERATGARNWVPAAEVTENKDGWTIKMALSGIDPKDVSVELDQGVLTIAGERSHEEENAEKHLTEFGYGRFERRFTVPDTVAGDKIVAGFDHGMLTLSLPVTEATKPRRIEIGASSSTPSSQAA